MTQAGHKGGPLGDPGSLQSPYGTPAGMGGALQCGPFTSSVTQCTCLAYVKRPDIYNTAVNVKHVAPPGGYRAVGNDRTDYYVWDAAEWLIYAQAAGIPTGSQPVPGSIAVFGTPNAADWGHVQYVEQVASPTWISVDECNYDWHGSCRYGHWENPQAQGERLQGYIYGGTAGDPSGGSTNPGAANSSGSDDLWFVKTKNTGSGHVEVHSATAASGYLTGQHRVTWFSPADADNGWFQMVGQDLYFIKTKNTGSGHVEVHTATAASGYTSGQHFVTWLSPADASNGWFEMVGGDLYFVKTKNTGSGHVEVHSATVGSDYSAAGQHSITWLSPADADNGWFEMAGGAM